MQSTPTSEEVEQLLLNARLRDELEPFSDDSLALIQARRLPTARENEYLASMLAWERAPALPIKDWFDPPLEIPPPNQLDDQQLTAILWDTIYRLYEKRIILRFTDHLSDRELYCVLYRDILPACEKKVDLPDNYLLWHCLDAEEDPQTWLRYYATARERKQWAAATGQPLPPAQVPPYPRKLPDLPI